MEAALNVGDIRAAHQAWMLAGEELDSRGRLRDADEPFFSAAVFAPDAAFPPPWMTSADCVLAVLSQRAPTGEVGCPPKGLTLLEPIVDAVRHNLNAEQVPLGLAHEVLLELARLEYFSGRVRQARRG